jgi:hypothetical protein|eukprot:CAMPEP_0185585322 /NCGR_PEP_ID=MMETSP0434-20130131/38007_1 /TAXON_ID=626734 ORGANISM="Favella taraikaensis, Strain Fe Narragansett Bay" /NCGR_SAMPLE_ID=MMETSP0434 /ASSEMBLY_ACC=CAM_ASM_000379 /LENGTH=110 /DNA_ID=CAMNT_0028205587 /DNA_START=411 /DNA_END=743 /DNA_ORIENTATION=-
MTVLDQFKHQVYKQVNEQALSLSRMNESVFFPPNAPHQAKDCPNGLQKRADLFRNSKFEPPAQRVRSPMTKGLLKKPDLNISSDRPSARFEKCDQKDSKKISKALRFNER